MSAEEMKLTFMNNEKEGTKIKASVFGTVKFSEDFTKA